MKVIPINKTFPNGKTTKIPERKNVGPKNRRSGSLVAKPGLELIDKKLLKKIEEFQSEEGQNSDTIKILLENAKTDDIEIEEDLEVEEKENETGKDYINSDDKKETEYTSKNRKDVYVPVKTSQAEYHARIREDFDNYVGDGMFDQFKNQTDMRNMDKLDNKSPSEGFERNQIQYDFGTSQPARADTQQVSLEYVSKVKNSVETGVYEKAKSDVLDIASYLTGRGDYGCAGCAVNQIYNIRDQINGGTYTGKFNTNELLNAIDLIDNSLRQFKGMHSNHRTQAKLAA